MLTYLMYASNWRMVSNSPLALCPKTLFPTVSHSLSIAREFTMWSAGHLTAKKIRFRNHSVTIKTARCSRPKNVATNLDYNGHL